MGKAKYWELKALSPRGKPKYFEKSLGQLGHGDRRTRLVHIPALSQKAKMLMMLKDWDQALDTTERVLNRQVYSDDIECLRVAILCFDAERGRQDGCEKDTLASRQHRSSRAKKCTALL